MTLAEEFPTLYLWWVACDEQNGHPVGAVLTRSCCGTKAVAAAMRIAWPNPKATGRYVKVDAQPIDPLVLLPADMMNCLLPAGTACTKAKFIIESQLLAEHTTSKN